VIGRVTPPVTSLITKAVTLRLTGRWVFRPLKYVTIAGSGTQPRPHTQPVAVTAGMHGQNVLVRVCGIIGGLRFNRRIPSDAGSSSCSSAHPMTSSSWTCVHVIGDDQGHFAAARAGWLGVQNLNQYVLWRPLCLWWLLLSKPRPFARG
jgi:hypothetical protein